MRAVRLHAFGGPELLQLEDLGIPTPGTNEALIRVHAAGVNPVDVKTREGKFPAINQAKLPITLGQDVSGTVEMAGPGVRSYNLGESVMAFLPPGRGGYAEFALVRESEMTTKPRDIDHLTAAAIPLAASTALQALFEHGQVGAGQRLLIHGAAGGVGHFAVQLAALAGAEVIATASADDHDFLRSLGADRVIDYRAQRFEDEVSEVDLVLDLIGGETLQRSIGIVKDGGRLVSTVDDPPAEATSGRQIQATRFMAEPRAADLKRLANLVAEGQLRAVVDRVFPMSQVAAAHRHLETQKHRGKLVLAIEEQGDELVATVGERREGRHDAALPPENRGR